MTSKTADASGHVRDHPRAESAGSERGHVERGGERIPSNQTSGEIDTARPRGPTPGGGGGGAAGGGAAGAGAVEGASVLGGGAGAVVAGAAACTYHGGRFRGSRLGLLCSSRGG